MDTIPLSATVLKCYLKYTSAHMISSIPLSLLSYLPSLFSPILLNIDLT